MSDSAEEMYLKDLNLAFAANDLCIYSLSLVLRFFSDPNYTFELEPNNRTSALVETFLN